MRNPEQSFPKEGEVKFAERVEIIGTAAERLNDGDDNDDESRHGTIEAAAAAMVASHLREQEQEQEQRQGRGDQQQQQLRHPKPKGSPPPSGALKSIRKRATQKKRTKAKKSSL